MSRSKCWSRRDGSPTDPLTNGWGSLSRDPKMACTSAGGNNNRRGALPDPLKWEVKGGEAQVNLAAKLPATAVKEQHSDQVPEFVSVQHYDLSRNEPSH